MKLFTLYTSLFFLVSSIRGEDSILNSVNFATEVNTGTWLIKFYSPYCTYSKKLAPIWEQFSNDNGETLATKNIHIGELNCIEYGTLCEENKVDGYPTINLFHNGKYVEEYTGPRDAQALADYAASKVTLTNIVN
ncbi:hypothetical protein K7432_012936 [Basidiobolus ranarum]|uniref:Thioredoxin domain-containing protein n=1 Tax=Basidiobolus ranarum TaxID=34480 RepID=A0ABR2VRH7_9FUNG